MAAGRGPPSRGPNCRRSPVTGTWGGAEEGESPAERHGDFADGTTAGWDCDSIPATCSAVAVGELPLAVLFVPRHPMTASPQLARWRRWLLGGWLLILGVVLGFYVTHAEEFTPRQIAADLRQFEHGLLLLYLLASVTRALVLIPSTPFVLAGCLLFPQRLALVLGISLLGIALSATLIYHFTGALGLDRWCETRHPRQVERLTRLLSGRWGFGVLVAWAFFPLAPTDLACYLAGALKLPFWSYLLAICLGELLVCAGYVWLSQTAW